MPDVTQISNGNIIERAFTAEERQQAEQDLIDGAAQIQAEQSLAAARESALAKLAAIGLTSSEIQALVGT